MSRRNPEVDSRTDQPDIEEARTAFRRYAVASARGKEQKGLADTLRDVLLSFAEAHGTEDTSGHREFDFGIEVPLPGGKSASKLIREKRTSEQVNLERTRALAEEKGLTTRIFKEQVIEVFQEEELYACYQEDLISEEELSSLIDVSTTYALKVR